MVEFAASTTSAPWYRTLSRNQWKALLASNLGWLFDGFEAYTLILTIGVALRQLLEPGSSPQIPFYAGLVISVSLLGWGLGGLIGGVLADYVGRKRMMMFSIVGYSVLTGLSALSYDWISFACLRFLVGLALGSEWATGASMMAEILPANARGRGAGLMQAAGGIGLFLASLLWLPISSMGAGSWRYMFLIGIVPAFLALWIRMSISESALWEKTRDARDAANSRHRRGEVLSPQDEALTRFTFKSLFVDSKVRGRIFIVFLMGLSTTLGWYGASSWIPPYIGSIAAEAKLPAQEWASYAGMAHNAGGIAGYALFGFLADGFGRKPITFLFFLGALIMIPVMFMTTHDPDLLLVLAAITGFFSLGLYSWLASWVPELFPTRIRATALAFAFNGPRLLSCAGPFVAGTLIVSLGGYSKAATIVGSIYILGLLATPFLPETRGQPLPE